MSETSETPEVAADDRRRHSLGLLELHIGRETFPISHVTSVRPFFDQGVRHVEVLTVDPDEAALFPVGIEGTLSVTLQDWWRRRDDEVRPFGKRHRVVSNLVGGKTGGLVSHHIVFREID